jgi:hypothetical protein
MGNRKAGGYDPVQIFNSTSFNAFGKVEYASILCSDDNYNVQRDETWKASSRGVCLVTRITATVRAPSGNIQADMKRRQTKDKRLVVFFFVLMFLIP